MAHVIEPAATGRSKCRGCGLAIAAGELRFGEVVPNPFADGETTQWFHVECGAYKRPEPFLEALAATSVPVPDAARLEGEARRGVALHRLPRVNGLERASSGRAQCRSCREAIEKNAWRISLVFYEDNRFSPAGFVHLKCCGAYVETTDVLARLRRFSPKVTDEELAEVKAELEKYPPPAPTTPSPDPGAAA